LKNIILTFAPEGQVDVDPVICSTSQDQQQYKEVVVQLTPQGKIPNK